MFNLKLNEVTILLKELSFIYLKGLATEAPIKLFIRKQNLVIGATFEPVRLRDVYELIYSFSWAEKTSYLCSLFEVSRPA